MTPWSLEWSEVGLRDFVALPSWETAARVDEALMRLAATHEGPLRTMIVDGLPATVLLVPPYAAVLRRDRTRRALLVGRIVRYA